MIDHVGFAVGDIGRSRAFYDAALAAGGRDKGGPRPHHGADHHAAFVIDPDGANIEAAWRTRG